jgi:hypothetical protein
MGLDLLPRSEKTEHAKLPRGKTHLDDDACPFGDHPVGVLASCCCFRGSHAALYLLGLGLGEFATRLFRDLTPQQTLEMAPQLRQVVKRLQDAFEGAARKAGKPDEEEDVDDASLAIDGVGWSFRFGDAAAAVEALASWYEKVDQMGFGVKAWF